MRAVGKAGRLRLLPLGLLVAAAACSGVVEPEDRLTLEVAEVRVPCMGVAPQECYLVRSAPGGELSLFYDGIAGFEFERGHRYVLRVGRREVKDPPADASAFEYRLLHVQSKERSPRYELVVRVEQAEALWRQTRPVAYDMVQERRCFCTPDGRGPVRLEVTREEGGAVTPFERVVAQHYVSDERAVGAEYAPFFLTVQDLFGHLRHAIARDAHLIDAEFDAASGYPRRAFVDWHAALADEEIEYAVLSLDAAGAG